MSDARVSSELRRKVRDRANLICEYCLLAEEDSYYGHQIEHIVSLKHGGSSDLDNLALACIFCNRNKGTDLGSIVTGTSNLVRFYNPRTDIWAEHFRLEGVMIKPLTEIAVVTARIFQFNNEDRKLEREILIRLNRFPNGAAMLLARAYS